MIACLESYGITKGEIEFEVTESTIITNLDECAGFADKIKEKGLHLSIDDFGTGYSSLSRLIDLPVSKLKIDRSLIRNINNRADALAIVRGVVNIAHDLNLLVVAEGVENSKQADLLAEIKCDLLQGFGIGMPRGIDDALIAA